MMSTYVTGMVIGGILISILGGIGEYLRESVWPKPKAMARDFLIGAILVVFLMQILPESMTNLLSFIPSLDTFSNKLTSLTALAGSAVSTSVSDSPDLQLGPVRF